MKAVLKTKLLDQLENRVELQLQAVVGRLQNLSETVLLEPAPSGGWSIAQCLEHLNSYGRYYLPAIRNGFQKTGTHTPSSIFSSTWLGSYFTRMMQPGNPAKKYKAPKEHSPVRELDAAQVVANFIAQQEELLVLVRKAKQADLNKVRVPVSIAKWIKLKLGDVLQFLVAHNERHLQQALRQL